MYWSSVVSGHFVLIDNALHTQAHTTLSPQTNLQEQTSFKQPSIYWEPQKQHRQTYISEEINQFFNVNSSTQYPLKPFSAWHSTSNASVQFSFEILITKISLQHYTSVHLICIISCNITIIIGSSIQRVHLFTSLIIILLLWNSLRQVGLHSSL